MIILGIETSCDECSAAVVRDGHEILSNVIATQIELHKPYQGVVPELASRLHTEWIQQVVEASLRQAGITNKELDAVAVTSRPGLLGSLLVGVSFAKCYALCPGSRYPIHRHRSHKGASICVADRESAGVSISRSACIRRSHSHLPCRFL